MRICLIFSILVIAMTPSLRAAESFTACTMSNGGILINGPDGLALRVSPLVWGPGWAWTGMKSTVTASDGIANVQCVGSMGKTGVPFTLTLRIAHPEANRLAIDWTLRSDAETDLTLAVLSLEAGSAYPGSARAAVVDNGTETIRDVPFGKEALGTAVSTLRWLGAGPEATIALTCNPPAVIQADGVARLVMAAGHLGAEAQQGQATIQLPAATAWYPRAEDVPLPENWDQWFVWSPKDGTGPGAIGMNTWSEPAGTHGRVQRVGDRLEVGGKPVRFWGLNLCYATCAPDHELADRRADFYAKHGINAVRLHKYADGSGWAGIQSEESFATLDAAGLERLDYFVAALKKRGIYVVLSPTFMVKLGAGDREAVPYLDEFGALANKKGARVDTKHGSIYLAQELQDLAIAQVVQLLAHRNPYTELTYAEDPAVLMVEAFNEDSSLFFGTMSTLQNVPTLRRRAGAAFTAWLKKRYGTQDALLAAWGPNALNSFQNEKLVGESWEQDSIVPAGNPWFYDPAQLEGSQAPKKARLLDTMRFLYELENAYYDRFVDGMRSAGYTGEIIASNWQAGRAFSHYLNLHADARIGIVDRHNYQGGSESLLTEAGSGMLSTGMQQVAGSPFCLSEWIHVFPNERGAEGPVIIGAYGLGLQGWDASFMFQNRDAGTWSDRIGRETWDVVAPQVFATFPAVARQVRRGDVAMAKIEATRKVNVDALSRGEIGFDDRVAQNHDQKSLDSSIVSRESLALVRSTVTFTEQQEATVPFDLTPYVKDGELIASTQQLRWREGANARVVIDTPATQGVIGSAAGETITCGDCSLQLTTAWAFVSVTVADEEGVLSKAPRLLVTTVARARNDDMRWVGSELLAAGKKPIRMEPVVATLRLRRAGVPTVYVLDHDGQRTEQTVPVVDGSIVLDGEKYAAVWYEIVYP